MTAPTTNQVCGLTKTDSVWILLMAIWVSDKERVLCWSLHNGTWQVLWMIDNGMGWCLLWKRKNIRVDRRMPECSSLPRRVSFVTYCASDPWTQIILQQGNARPDWSKCGAFLNFLPFMACTKLRYTTDRVLVGWDRATSLSLWAVPCRLWITGWTYYRGMECIQFLRQRYRTWLMVCIFVSIVITK